MIDLKTEEILSLDQAAKKVRVSFPTIWRWALKGCLPPMVSPSGYARLAWGLDGSPQPRHCRSSPIALRPASTIIPRP
jgi:predicted DNA-binding transcriptional regulator AlpA